MTMNTTDHLETALAIEQLCAAGQPVEAGHVREELDRFVFEPVALALFDRTVSPTIVSAAVRLGQWTTAEAYLARYASSESDSVERERLRSWVETRKFETAPVFSGLRF